MDIATVSKEAWARYEGLAEKKKQKARKVFEAVDMDNSGDVCIDEFIDILSDLKLQNDNHYWLFAQLDEDNNGTLDFKELVTFFYILKHDKYKKLLNSQPSNDVPGWKARFSRRRRRRKKGENNQGRRSKWLQIVQLLATLLQIGQCVTETECSIL